MQTDTFRYAGADGTEITTYRWASESAAARGIIQLAHGAGEHAGRYLTPLTPIIDAGFVVYAVDHRGHGATAGPEDLGDFGTGGPAAAVDDMAVLSRRIRAEHSNLPLVLFGHSMGAMFAQAYLLTHSELIDALVMSGTAAPGPRLPGGPNAAYANPRTNYDWLSRDDAEVDRYIADPLCGIRFTPSSMEGLGALRETITTGEGLDRVRKDLPIYVFVGDEDPINAKLARLTPLIDRYREAGLRNVDVKVYPGGRHEMLNETNRDEVVADLLAWLETAVAQAAP